ncbi:MAG TPA: YdcF family protein [Terriglobales bacterium]|nr:YdcF family protein [Terriglobales bacterium]
MMRELNNPEVIAGLNHLCRYLALDDFEPGEFHVDDVVQRAGLDRFDVIALFGNELPATLTEACQLFQSGLSRFLLFSGGRGHSTQPLFANLARSSRYQKYAKQGWIGETLPEAEAFARLAKLEFGIPGDKILVEDASTNTGENARFTLDLLTRRIPAAHHMLLLQDPLMQRRAVLTVAKALESVANPIRCFSRAAFVPEIVLSASGEWEFASGSAQELWSKQRFLSIVLGEIKRLRNDENGYGPRGRNFLPAVEIPADVLASYTRLLQWVGSDGLERT